MARKKLTEKLKAEIKANPYRLKKSDFSGDALKYLNRVRGARKAVKTKARKQVYINPKRKSRRRKETPSDFIAGLAKSEGMSVKKYRQKYKESITEFEKTGRTAHNRDSELLKDDIEFSPDEIKVYINKRKTSKVNAVYYLTRLKRRMIREDLIYPEISIRFSYDFKGNIYIDLPKFDKLESIGDNYEELIYIQDNFKIAFWWK